MPVRVPGRRRRAGPAVSRATRRRPPAAARGYAGPVTSPPPRLVPALAAALAATAVAGCGGDDDGDEPPATARVVKESVPWKLSSVDGRRLTVTYEAGTCAGEEMTVEPRVDEDAERVRIAVVARRQVHGNACAGLVKIGQLRVTLTDPLGDRRLVHAPVRAPGGAREELRCPAPRNGGSGRLDARRLTGLTTAAARRLARRFGCTVRVVVRNGQSLPRTRDYRPNRVDVRVYDGRVVGIDGIG